MTYTVSPRKDWNLWDYMEGNIHKDMSIATARQQHLWKLNWMEDEDLQMSLRDPDTNRWTKWQSYYKYSTWQIRYSPDIHRKILWNEIVLESDYPSYDENYDAIKAVAPIIEDKGFKFHYYYSGNKSVHAHAYFDFRSLLEMDEFLQEKVVESFTYRGHFINAFMKWLRERIITQWDMRIREFDEDLVNPKHLIRSELSRNKQGFKTFLGYNHDDISFVPVVCNEENRIYPKIGDICLSRPFNIQDLVEEFLDSLAKTKRVQSMRRKDASLNNWFDKDSKELKPCVKFLLSDDFSEVGDGYKRAMFILSNQLKKKLGEGVALDVLLNWNTRMGHPVNEGDIKYRVKSNKVYNLTCNYIHEFLERVGVDASEYCS